MPAQAKGTARKPITPHLALIIAWILSLLGPLSFLIIPLLPLFLALAAVRRSKGFLLAALLHPLSVHFAFGAADWFSPYPSFFGMGLPSPRGSNLDPATRCWQSTGGCVVTGEEWVSQYPHNLALTFMCGNFGPPPATYHSAYPSETEAKALTEIAPETPAAEFLEGTLVTAQSEIKIGKEISTLLMDDLNQRDIEYPDLAQATITAAQTNGCLIVRLRTRQTFAAESAETSEAIALIDGKTLRPFARYPIEGRVPRIPAFPKLWR